MLLLGVGLGLGLRSDERVRPRVSNRRRVQKPAREQLEKVILEGDTILSSMFLNIILIAWGPQAR